jgi:hypothetical protein
MVAKLFNSGSNSSSNLAAISALSLLGKEKEKRYIFIVLLASEGK